MKEKPFIIAIAGASGSGKTRMVKEVGRLLNGTTLNFDDYSHSMEWPKTIKPEEGVINLRDVKLTNLAEDIKSLLRGEKILDPRNEEKHPTKFIVVEDPHGRERREFEELYDYIVLIDTPLEICLSRAIIRAFAGEYFAKINGERVKQEEADPKEKLTVLDNYIFGPYWTRDFYESVNILVRKNCDLIVDGMGTIKEMAHEIVTNIKEVGEENN